MKNLYSALKRVAAGVFIGVFLIIPASNAELLFNVPNSARISDAMRGASRQIFSQISEIFAALGEYEVGNVSACNERIGSVAGSMARISSNLRTISRDAAGLPVNAGRATPDLRERIARAADIARRPVPQNLEDIVIWAAFRTEALSSFLREFRMRNDGEDQSRVRRLYAEIFDTLRLGVDLSDFSDTAVR